MLFNNKEKVPNPRTELTNLESVCSNNSLRSLSFAVSNTCSPQCPSKVAGVKTLLESSLLQYPLSLKGKTLWFVSTLDKYVSFAISFSLPSSYLFFCFVIYLFLFRFQNVCVVRSGLPLSASILFSKCILRNNAQNNVAQCTEKDSAPLNVFLFAFVYFRWCDLMRED